MESFFALEGYAMMMMKMMMMMMVMMLMLMMMFPKKGGVKHAVIW